MNTATTQRKERIRGPELAVLIKKANGVPLVDGLARADNENRVIASNKRIDKALVGNDEWQKIRGALTCRSGTMTGYEKPGKKLGKSVQYIDPETNQKYVFPVPEDYKGVKDAILAVEHPDYTLEKDGKDLIVVVQNLENIDLVEGFPSESGWYLTDAKHGIPVGDQTASSDSDARYLWKTVSRVGSVSRSTSYYYDWFSRNVVLDDKPSNSLGVAVEAPKDSAPEKLQVERKEGELIIKGTPEQLDAAIKLLQ